jgi:hypothetical protein
LTGNDTWVHVGDVEQRSRNGLSIVGILALRQDVKDDLDSAATQKELLRGCHSGRLHVPVLRRRPGKAPENAQRHVARRNFGAVPQKHRCGHTFARLLSSPEFLDEVVTEERRVKTVYGLKNGAGSMYLVAICARFDGGHGKLPIGGH